MQPCAGRAATQLARHGGRLHLHGLTRISDGAAAAFGRRTGLLCLKNLRRLPPSQALQLAGHRGPLHLYSLHWLDAAVAACLGQHQGAPAITVADDIPLARLALLVRHPLLGLDRMTSLDDGVARILAGHQGASLSLAGLQHVGDAALARLRANPAVHLPRWLRERTAA